MNNQNNTATTLSELQKSLTQISVSLSDMTSKRLLVDIAESHSNSIVDLTKICQSMTGIIEYMSSENKKRDERLDALERRTSLHWG